MPGKYEVHIDSAMSQFAVMYSQAENWFIGDKVMPVKNVKKDSDYYFYADLKDITTLPARDRRASGTSAQEVEYGWSSTTYVAYQYALKDKVPDDVRANADAPLTPDQDTVKVLTELILLGREKRVADIMFDTSTTFASYTSALSGGDQWDEYSTSDPFGDVETAINSVEENSGKPVNCMIMGKAVFSKVRHHPDVLDRVKYNGGPSNPAKIQAEHLAQAFDVEKCYVGRAIYNSANKGQTATFARLWGKYVGFYHIDPNPGTKTVTAGMTLRSRPFRVRKWYDTEIESTWYEVSIKDDEVCPVAAAGYVYSTVVD